MFIPKTEIKTAVDNDYDTIQNRDRHCQLVETTTKQRKHREIFNETLKKNNNKQ